jgi:hypothetical protein
MAWTYDPNLITDTDRVRLLIGDTLESDPLISDEELVALLSLAGGITEAAAQASEAIATMLGRRADEISDDIGQRVKYGDRAGRYRTLAASLRASVVSVSAGSSVAVANQAVW